MKPESNETPADELKETPAQQAKEKNEGTEQHPQTAESGVVVSEEFQKAAHKLIHKASKHEVKHIHDRANMRDEELRKEQQAQEETAKPSEFSAAEELMD
jgi:hypothetical protein